MMSNRQASDLQALLIEYYTCNKGYGDKKEMFNTVFDI